MYLAIWQEYSADGQREGDYNFIIAQESLNNEVKYARVSQVDINVRLANE